MIISKPLEYFKEQSFNSSKYNPHYGSLSNAFDNKLQFENLYIYKIKLNEKQLIICQLYFQSFLSQEIKQIK